MKRLFFGIEASAPWPESFPKGRILKPEHRHITLAFLGSCNPLPLLEILNEFPKTPLAFAAISDKCLFLPPNHPNVAAWHLDFGPSLERLKTFHKQILDWLETHGYKTPDAHRPYLPHLTLARGQFNPIEWQNRFYEIPLFFSTIHLYESLGNSEYRPLWSQKLPLASEEIAHTADIAYRIRGSSVNEIFWHAELSLASQYPPLLKYRTPDKMDFKDLNDVIRELNSQLARLDIGEGAPFKAVSYHGELSDKPILNWDMIVDV